MAGVKHEEGGGHCVLHIIVIVVTVMVLPGCERRRLA